MTTTLRRTAETAIGYSIAAGAWAFAIATYPAAVACALALAPSARAFDTALTQHLERDRATKAANHRETVDQCGTPGPHDARAWTELRRGA